MNSDVIKEIANQLGIAADQVSQSVMSLGPQWAAMKIALAVPNLVIGLLLVAAAIAIAVASVRFCKALIEDGEDEWCSVGLVGAALFLALLFAGCFFGYDAASEIIRYSVAPDAAYLQDLWRMVAR